MSTSPANIQEASNRNNDAPERAGGLPKRSKVGARTSQYDTDDFVDDVPIRCQEEITKSRNDKGKCKIDDTDIIVKHSVDEASDVDVESDDDEVFLSVSTRTSAGMFVKAISGLSNAKKNAVREMGFGRLLELSITTTPLKMGFWLVNNFNHLDRKLQLYDGIKCTLRKKMYMLCLGCLVEISRPSNITTLKVLDKINECDDGGVWFKSHFIVLTVSCLFESCLNGIANSRIVHALDDLSDVRDMNWCSYMIKCLVDTKRSWDANSKQKKTYAGPLLFLMLFYVDKVVLSVRSVPRRFPTFISWSNEALRNRERDEIASGAFGRGFVDADALDIHQLDKMGTNSDDVTAGVPENCSVQALQVLLEDENFVKMNEAAHKLLGVYNELPRSDPNYPVNSQECGPIGKKDGVTAALDEVMNAIERRYRFKRMHNEGPNYSLGLGLTPDYVVVADGIDDGTHQLNVDVLDHVEAADGTPRPKRCTKVASIIKSPFKVRSIDVTKKLDAHEKMLANWVLKKDDEDGDVIIYQSSEFSAKKHLVSCLLPDSAITNELLDLWSCILNYNENFMSRGTSTCFYASTSLCIERQSLSNYLGQRSLVRRSKSVALSVPEVVCPAWTEDVDAADASVITMRHMETFKGSINVGYTVTQIRDDAVLIRF
ncbi:Unknown protein [Striga hermonthica]|uniref:Uncharacterized protein n=1 Tax=Striga hermonthica TaxID=68872 RepID=A0A9N7RFP5_STRHE|nr:Unknown protein [Striga hermonthica]